MNIHELFSTRERIKILKHILYLEKDFGVNEIAKKLKISKGLVSKYFEILFKKGILKKSGKKFAVRRDNLLVKGIKIMLNLEKIDAKVFKKYKFVKAVGLYGSCAKGTNTENSDVDLWIKVENAGEKSIVNLVSEIKKKLGNASVLVLDEKKIKLLKEKDSVFYYSLYFGSIIIYGEESEI